VALEDEALSLLRNRYDNYPKSLDAFQEFAVRHPDAAFCAAWQFVTDVTEEIDDGTCCFVLETSAKALGQSAVERKILEFWQQLGEFARLNVIDGIGSQTAISTELGIKLFHDPTTTVRERHRIVAGFAAGHPNRRVDNIDALSNEIGSYSDPEQQKTLDRFRAELVRNPQT